MPHADYSKFQITSKQEAYQVLLQSAQALLAGQNNWVANTANVSSLLWHMYKSLEGPLKNVNWAGFYVKDPQAENQLILGPFQGQVACQTITWRKGVCGTAASEKKTQLVKDVNKFPGHIACDSETNSEIVVPLLKNGECVGVIDIDCQDLNGFDELDQSYLEKLAELLVSSCEW